MFTILNTVLPDNITSDTQQKTTFSLPAGTLDYVHPLSDVAEEHIIIFKGVEYICNFLEDGKTKISVAYKVNNLDVIRIQMNRVDGSVDIIFRKNEGIEFNVGDSIKLVFTGKMPEPQSKALIRFSKDVAYLVSSDGTIEEV